MITLTDYQQQNAIPSWPAALAVVMKLYEERKVKIELWCYQNGIVVLRRKFGLGFPPNADDYLYDFAFEFVDGAQ